VAFGDPYVKGQCNAEGFCNQPVYMVDAEGDIISVQAIAVASDRRVWFASGRTTTVDVPRGLAAWDGKNFSYTAPGAAGMSETDVRDMLDQMVSPPTLHVATWGGAAAIRKLP
jgi:hypothetical protein